MNVLFLTPDLLGPPGGIARYGRMVCLALLNAADVTVVALRDSGEAVAEADSAFPGMNYRPCSKSRYEFVRRSAVETVRQRPTVVLVSHVNFAPVGWLLARLTGAVLITVVHGVEIWRPRNVLLRWAVQHSDRVFSVSQFTARCAEEANGISIDSVRILPNCLDPKFECSVMPDQDAPRLSLLTVGRMRQADLAKGYAQVIRAMPELLARFPDLVCHIVGDGPARSNLEALARQEGVVQAIRFLGVIPDQELSRRYAEASVFVMPSQKEGFGIVFLEAMSHGLPVIGGSMDATSEVVIDGETGYLVDPTSVEALTEAVVCLLADEDKRWRMGQAGRRHVMQNFSFRRFQQCLLAHLSEFVALSL